MNERIKSLWEKAAESTAALPSGRDNSWETQVNFLDKFAELIVRECMSLCQECIDDGCVEAEEPLSKIKQHFGVE